MMSTITLIPRIYAFINSCAGPPTAGDQIAFLASRCCGRSVRAARNSSIRAIVNLIYDGGGYRAAWGRSHLRDSRKGQAPGTNDRPCRSAMGCARRRKGGRRSGNRRWLNGPGNRKPPAARGVSPFMRWLHTSQFTKTLTSQRRTSDGQTTLDELVQHGSANGPADFIG